MAAYEGAGDLLRSFARFAGARAAGAVALIAIGALFESVSLLLLVPFLGLLLDGALQPDPDGMFGEIFAWFRDGRSINERLFILLGLFAALVIGRSIVLSRRDRLLAQLQHGFIEATRLRLIDRIARAPWHSVVRLNHSRIVHALSFDMQQIGLAAHYALQCTVAAVMLAANCAIAMLLAPAAAAIALSMLLLGGLTCLSNLRRAHALGNALFEVNVQVTDGAIRLFDGLKLATAQNRQAHFVSEYAAASAAVVEHRVDFAGLLTSIRNRWLALAALTGGATVLVSVLLLRPDPAVLIALLLILSRMGGPAMLVLHGTQQILHSLSAYLAVRTLEDELPSLPAQAPRAADPRGFRPAGCAIELDDVSFFHSPTVEGDRAGVRHLDVAIAADSFVGIGGPSGSGKTSFIDLTAGLLMPQSGVIRVDGAVLDHSSLDAHRDRISYAGQDPVLFGDTLRRNLAWAAPAASDAAMLRAIELMGAGDLIRRLGNGLDSMVGERGVLISAGERQRLNLARALLREPALLILDEATGSIDVESEREIFAALRSLIPRPTILMVSHRAESLAQCDRVLSFANGRLVDDSSVDRLDAVRNGSAAAPALAALG